MSTVAEMITTILLAVAGVAVFALLGSKKAQFPQVIQAGASGFGNMLAVAESPVTGAHYNIDLTYPGHDLTGAFGGIG